jgi:hypothetical protein
MGSWFLVLSLSLLVVLFGLYIHWSVVLLGALLPFIPVLSALRERRSSRDPDQRQPGNDDL